MKKYTYGAYDWNCHLVEMSVVAESKGAAGKMVRGILEKAREFIDIDEDIFLISEVDCE